MSAFGITLVIVMVAGLALAISGWRTMERDSMAGGELAAVLGVVVFVIAAFLFFGVPIVAAVFGWWG